MLLNSLEELVIHKNADGSIDVHRKH
jgi:sugar-phosphatase